MNPPLQNQPENSDFNQNPYQDLSFMQVWILESTSLLTRQLVNRKQLGNRGLITDTIKSSRINGRSCEKH
jgi:hypothetical protein